MDDDILVRLQGYNPPDRTIDEEREVSRDIQSAAAEIVGLRAELETYKRLYKLRGQALMRPCLHCGYEPLRITLADGSVEETKDG